MMQILAPVDNIRFDIEEALDKQTYATVPLPFPGIDSKSSFLFIESPLPFISFKNHQQLFVNFL
jgi:hypothetical protein